MLQLASYRLTYYRIYITDYPERSSHIDIIITCWDRVNSGTKDDAILRGQGFCVATPRSAYPQLKHYNSNSALQPDTKTSNHFLSGVRQRRICSSISQIALLSFVSTIHKAVNRNPALTRDPLPKKYRGKHGSR